MALIIIFTFKNITIRNLPIGKVSPIHPNYEVIFLDRSFLFYNNLRLHSKGKKINGVKQGYWEYFNKFSKNKELSGHYHNDKRTGPWYGYNENSNVILRCNYIKDLLEGEWILYNFTNGTLLRRSHYKKGLLNGTDYIYNGLGELVEEGTWKNGIEEGVWIIYEDCSGLIKYKEHYVSGVLREKEFFKYGKLKSKKTLQIQPDQDAYFFRH